MTYIQPAKKSALNSLVFALGLAVISGVLFLVVIYNRVVDMEHGISAIRAEIKKAQVESAELQEKILALFSPENFSGIVAGKLVMDTNPEYLEIGGGAANLKIVGLRPL